MSSEASSSNTLESAEIVEFTLQDTYENLKDIQKEKQREIEELTEAIKNNPVHTLGRNTTIEDIIKKQQQLLNSLEKRVLEEDPKHYPIPKTDDVYITALQGLEDEVNNMNTLLDEMKKEFSILRNDVNYLEDKKLGFLKMKEVALNIAEDNPKNTYEEEYTLVKRIFTECKADLGMVIDLLFPENNELTEFLLDLSRAQLKGGDDVYVEIDQKNIQYTNFLGTTGIIVYHPHDKNVCKMVNLL